MSVHTNTLPAWTRRNCAVCPLHPHRASFLPPNNSMEPTPPIGSRAKLSERPGGAAHANR
jgi:hypothetical protein